MQWAQGDWLVVPHGTARLDVAINGGVWLPPVPSQWGWAAACAGARHVAARAPAGRSIAATAWSSCSSIDTGVGRRRKLPVRRQLDLRMSRLVRVILRSELGGAEDDPAGSGGARDNQGAGITRRDQRGSCASAGRERGVGALSCDADGGGQGGWAGNEAIQGGNGSGGD